MRFIKHLGVGHHPFSKKYEFKGYFNEPTPSLIATDYKAPKTVLELWTDDYKAKESDNMTETFKQFDTDEQADFTQTEAEEWVTELAIREKEGSPVPREIERKTYEQHSFTYASLFSGIGGFEQALDKFGGNCVFSSEIDKFASKAYETLYGEDVLHGDVMEIDAKDVPDHDLLVGGFPCQSFSVAGNRGGFEDARGTLFFEVARIADEKKPKAILAENVKGIVGHDKGKTLDTIVKTLNDIGYRVDFEVLNSKYFGVPQNRERIFILAVRDDLIDNEPWNNTKGTTVVPKGKRRISGYDDVKTFNFDWPEHEEVTTRLRDILEPEVDEKYYLSDDKTAKLVAQLEDKHEDIKGMVRGGSQKNAYEGDGSLSPTITEAMGQGGGHIPLRVEPQMLGHVDIKGNDSIKRDYSPDGINPTLTTMGGGHREPKIAERKTVIDDTQGFDGVRLYDDETPTIRSNRHGLKIAEAQEVRPVLTPERMEKRQNGRLFKEDGEESFTLTSQDRHGIAIKEATTKGYAVAAEGDAVNFQFPDSKTRRGRVGKKCAQTLEASSINQGTPIKDGSRYRIRKLTPLECWRLQGFSDEAHEAVKQAGLSDTQLYKQAGNAVTVNVIEAIGERLVKLLT